MVARLISGQFDLHSQTESWPVIGSHKRWTVLPNLFKTVTENSQQKENYGRTSRTV
jgi:hypothetical protein